MSYREGLRALVEAAEETADELDRVDASIRGMHAGIADMHRDLMRKLDRIADRLDRIDGQLTNHQIVANTIPEILRRVAVLEEHDPDHVNGRGSNGTA